MRITVHLCVLCFRVNSYIHFQHQAHFYSKSYVHSPLGNGNSEYLDTKVTIRGPLLLAPALHVDQVGLQVVLQALSWLPGCPPGAFPAFQVVARGFVSRLPASLGFNIRSGWSFWGRFFDQTTSCAFVQFILSGHVE